MEEQVQKAVDCYNAGATVLHLHVRELDGKGSKRLSKFNELIAGVRKAVPDMIIQVGGSISFAPETDGAKAKWLSDDTRHMLAELDPKPDQVTVTVNTTQMNVVEQMEIDDIAGTSLAEPQNYQAYREMIVPSSPSWVEEHVRRLSAAGIQSAFQFYNINSYETVERMIRRGVYKGPLVMNWVAIGGGMDQPTIYSLAHFLRAIPDGSMLTVESSMRNVLPINMMGLAMGLHVRCGIEDNLWNQSRTAKMTHRASRSSSWCASRASSAARSPAARKRARSARSACSTTRWRRRWPPTASPPTPRDGSRVSCARPPEVGDERADRPHRPGAARPRRAALADPARGALRAAGAGRSVPPMGRDDLDCAARVAAIERDRAGHRRADRGRRAQRRLHHGGALGAADARARVHGALLAAPPDFDTPMPDGYPTLEALRAGGWLPVPRERLPFPSIVAASRNDPLGRYERVGRAGATMGRPPGRPRRGRPPEPGLGLRRVAAGARNSFASCRADQPVASAAAV